MKKWILGAASLLLLFLLGDYLFIPAKLVVSRTIIANANQAGVYRFLNDDANWVNWWPGPYQKANDGKLTFQSGKYQFVKTQSLFESFEINIENGGNVDTSHLFIFLINRDSIKVNWSTTVSTGNNPFSKIRNYFKARETGNQFETILAAMQKHITDVRNIYGVDIKKEKVAIEYMVAMNKSFARYPATEDIYDMLGQIKSYIAQSGAKQEDYPMLHIKTRDSLNFEAQVAIPVDKNLPNNDVLISKRMLKGGNILVAEVTGGNHKADEALKQVRQYASDRNYTNIAISFYSLVTDRIAEPDSTKWKTKIYFPIM
jgi:hypothetical protein